MTGVDAPRYGNFAIALHWLIAALVVILVALGTWMTDPTLRMIGCFAFSAGSAQRSAYSNSSMTFPDGS